MYEQSKRLKREKKSMDCLRAYALSDGTQLLIQDFPTNSTSSP